MRHSHGCRCSWRRIKKGFTMAKYKVGYFVGSLAKASINRKLAKALIRLAPPELEFTEIPIKDLPLYSYDYDADYPPVARALKQTIADVDAVLFVTPEYNRSIPGGLKNAIDWASRPWGQNSFTRKPSAVIGASPGAIGTALAQQALRGVLGFCNSPQMNSIEAYIQFKPEVFTEDGDVTDEKTKEFLRNYITEFRDFIQRVLTVLPRKP
jgi:chromate reductase